MATNNIQRIVAAYQTFGDMDGFARVVSNDEVREKGSNISIPLYVQPDNGKGNGAAEKVSLNQAITSWQESSMTLRESMGDLLETFDKQKGNSAMSAKK